MRRVLYSFTFRARRPGHGGRRCRRRGLLARMGRGPFGRAGMVLLALALPLALGGAAPANGQQLQFPSASSVRSSLIRLADFVAGRQAPAPEGPA